LGRTREMEGTDVRRELLGYFMRKLKLNNFGGGGKEEKYANLPKPSCMASSKDCHILTPLPLTRNGDSTYTPFQPRGIFFIPTGS
jgi:hypothetical protein